jgi:O-antigen ligase
MYPHNLYLFLLFTVGITGLIAFLILLGTPLYRCWKAARQGTEDLVTLSFLKTGVVVMIVIFVDQIKVEFMRYTLVDYWHFVFALLGVLIAVCDRSKMLQTFRGR